MLPAAYTEFTLLAYMVTVTRAVAGALGWGADDFTEALNDTLIAYGVESVGDAGNIPKLRALAKVEAWRAVVAGTVADFNFSVDGGNYSREQIHTHAVEALTRALEQAAPYVDTTDGYGIVMGAMGFTDAYGGSNARTLAE